MVKDYPSKGLLSTLNPLNPPTGDENSLSQSANPVPDPLNHAKDDPRFDTFFKRLRFFQLRDETDQVFAKRLGVSFSQFKGWKYKGHLPNHPTIIRLGEILNICPSWLWWGTGHHVSLAPSGLRVTAIPRHSLFIEDYPDGPSETSIFFKKTAEGGSNL